MRFKTDEITSVIRDEIARYRSSMDVAGVGRVVEVGDGIAQIVGLSDVMAGEMLEFDGGAIGQVFNLAESSVGAVIYGPMEHISEGCTVRGTGRLLELPVGDEMLGRVIDPMGRPLDGGGDIVCRITRPVEVAAPGIADRQGIDEPLHTGIKAVDAMLPVGRGQRELIIGDRKTGKTAIAVDTIINQKDTGVLCVYVAIGQKESTVAGVVDTLKSHGAMDHTVVLCASGSDPAPLQYVAPYSGCSIAEHFMCNGGRATLIVYDDLTKHATAYRQISLLLRRPPGREAYPGDVFYLHSRLLERACKLAERFVIVPGDTADGAVVAPGQGAGGREYVGPVGRDQAAADLAGADNREKLKVHRQGDSGGSMTALPICETQEGQVAAYIPTNLISITDGQIYLASGLFFAGVRPAINVGISVSRVGYKAAWPAITIVAQSLRLDLAVCRELESFAQLGMELDWATQRQLDRGRRLVRLLTQPQYRPMPVSDQVIAIYAGVEGFLDELPVDEIPTFETQLLDHVRKDCGEFYEELQRDKTLSPERRKRLAAIIEQFGEVYRKLRRQRQKEDQPTQSDAGGQPSL